MLPWQPFLAFYIWGAHWRHLKNTTELSMCGGDAAFRQITLTICYHYHHHYQLLLHPRDGCDNNNNNNSSAAEMGDRLAKIDMGQKDGGRRLLCPVLEGKRGPI